MFFMVRLFPLLLQNLVIGIKVRIKGGTGLGGDDGVLDNKLPWCFINT
jgi:hypothetical protein